MLRGYLAKLLRRYANSLEDSMRARFSQELFRVLENEKCNTMLDCGCGDGAITRQIANFVGANKVIGLDIRKDFCEIAGKKVLSLIYAT